MEINSFGEAVKELRESSGIGSRELSRLVGMTETYISQVERGAIKKPDYFTALNILNKISNDVETINKIMEDTNIYPPDNFKYQLFNTTFSKNHDVLSWMDLEAEVLKTCIGLLTDMLTKIVERDYSRGKTIIPKLTEYLGDKDQIDFFTTLFSFDFSSLSADKRKYILDILREITSNKN
ncbi:helix-turn-helix domain-containing protein [Neobacillus sp. 179-C4.2 HS]|uniref:Helix-turn-helix domain-containing protein n=1 Tax=Neobacillus driksii TaxID=3035913 RepID=A0ABV4YTQ2_9BACI|nr:helix-turn-helix domain-containing protein [Neobacillus sp. 179.-C4.2 HS]MDP5195056.1 helix-turn-helix domain-containing protein [Neobacillus sp. 179.-C4.2 HS]